jgi:hypothetical protein
VSSASLRALISCREKEGARRAYKQL